MTPYSAAAHRPSSARPVFQVFITQTLPEASCVVDPADAGSWEVL